MPSLQLLIALLAAVVVLAALARRVPIPDPVVLVLGGLALGFVPGGPRVTLDPHVVLFVFLPPLVYSAAFLMSPEELIGNERPIALLATGLVLATMAGVAAVAHAVAGLPWDAAFVLGAVLGATDPVAATAVARRLGAPPRLATILEGEALINDGTGLAVYKIAVGAAGAAGFSAAGAFGRFVEISAGGIAVGAATSFLASLLRRRLREPRLEIATALVTAYAAYIIADRIGFSGVLAAVAAGLVAVRVSGPALAPSTRIANYAFWEVVVFILESLLFLLVGLEFPTLAGELRRLSALVVLRDVAAVAGAAVLLRALWLFTVPYLTAFVDRRLSRGRSRLDARERAVLSWSGMRGAVSLAAALSIPLTAGGHPFPARAEVIVLTYGTVLGTLVLPGLTLPALIRRLGLAAREDARRRAVSARMRLAEAALARADQLEQDEEVPERPLRSARELYELRLARLGAQIDDDADGAGDAECYRRLRRAMLEAERAVLAKLRSERRIEVSLAREIERDLDLEESRLR